MQEKKIYKLKIDDEFKNLIPELTKEETENLEAMLLKEGCREPICVWNNYIIDGHNRYFLCHKHKIPFNFQEVPDLESKEEAIDWMCSNQLGRRNISEETRKYLIGKRFNLEKSKTYKNNIEGRNQYSKNPKSIGYKTSHKIAKEYNISPNTVYRYASFANAIDNISQKETILANQILNGQVKFTQEDVKKLAQQRVFDLENITKQIDKYKVKVPTPAKERIKTKINKNNYIPDYDPDSDVMSLALTIPYWIDSIERIINKKDMIQVSKNAKWKLISELGNLDNKVQEITLIMENSDGEF